MRHATTMLRLSFALPALVAACAQQASPPPAGNATTAQAARLPPTCHFQTNFTYIRPQTTLPFRFQVARNAQWCFDGFGISGLSASGVRVLDSPTHGELRLLQRPGVVLFGYRPTQGYAGTDEFRVEMPVGLGYSSVFVGSVDITDAAASGS